jgi:hypothetical protein
LTGSKVQEFRLSGQKQITINRSELNAGVYVVTFISNEGFSVRKKLIIE